MIKYPIGIQDFRVLREGGFIYVDKTPIIYQLVEQGKFYFLSRPRRFGKSMLLSTLRELFFGKKALFKGLWIEDKWDWEQKHPVIHLSYNELAYKELGLRKALKLKLDEIAQEYDIKLQREALSERFRELIIVLARINKVALLIDEYDKPLMDFISNQEQLEENREILREFYSIIKGADLNLRFVILTGVSRFSKVSIFSDLNNLNDITIDQNFNAIAGYTQKELEDNFEIPINIITEKLNIERQDLLDQIKDWYNGYSWTGPDKLYNPHSTLNFFQKEAFQNFWFSTGAPSFLIEVLKKGFFFDLDQLEVGSVSLDALDIPNLDYRSLLFQTGYLTIKAQPYFNIYTLGYPNKEVKDALLQHLIGTYSNTPIGSSSPMVVKLKLALERNELDTFISILNGLFASIPEKIFRQRNEAAYHAIVFTSLSLLGLYITAEVTAGDGYVDAVVKTASHIYVMEFKYDRSPEEAIAQIRNKNYAEPYQHDGRQVRLVGISFGKEIKGITDWKVEKLHISSQD